MVQGKKSKFYTDVKMDVLAGMGKSPYIHSKLRVVGFEIYRLYFDTVDKDYQIGRERIRRVVEGVEIKSQIN